MPFQSGDALIRGVSYRSTTLDRAAMETTLVPTFSAAISYYTALTYALFKRRRPGSGFVPFGV